MILDCNAKQRSSRLAHAGQERLRHFFRGSRPAARLPDD